MIRALLTLTVLMICAGATAEEFDPIKSTSDRFNKAGDEITDGLNESLNSALDKAMDKSGLQGVCGMDFSTGGGFGIDLPDLSCDKLMPDLGFSPSLNFSPSEPITDTLKSGVSSGADQYFNSPSSSINGGVIDGFL